MQVGSRLPARAIVGGTSPPRTARDPRLPVRDRRRRLGARTQAAVRRAGVRRRLRVDGVAGPATLAALRPPVRALALRLPDPSPGRRPLMARAAPVSTRRPRLPRAQRRPRDRRRIRPRCVRRLGRRLPGPDRHARPRQRPAPATRTCRAPRSGREPRLRPGPRSAASARPASPPGHICTSRSRVRRRERRSGSGVRTLTPLGSEFRHRGVVMTTRRVPASGAGAARLARVSVIRSNRCSERREVEQDQSLVALLGEPHGRRVAGRSGDRRQQREEAGSPSATDKSRASSGLGDRRRRPHAGAIAPPRERDAKTASSSRTPAPAERETPTADRPPPPRHRSRAPGRRRRRPPPRRSSCRARCRPIAKANATVGGLTGGSSERRSSMARGSFRRTPGPPARCKAPTGCAFNRRLPTTRR